jgi:Cu/Ag efflux protein CusF
MKRNTLDWAGLALVSASMLAFTSCSSTSSTPTGQAATGVAYKEGVPGGVVVETYKMTATVTGIDADNRKVTLVTPEGKKTTVKCGPEVINFDQIHVGDQLNVTATEELAVFVRKNGEPANDGEAAAVALAPVGAKPGMLMANTVEVTGTVEAIDLAHRKATLRFTDGTSKTFKVRKDVDMTKGKIGDEVVFRTTEAVAISVEKP